MSADEFAGTGTLIRFILRRDRLLLPIWVALPPLFVILVAAAFAQLYPTAAEQQMFAAQIVTSPGFVALLGPISGATIGGLTAWRATIFVAVIVAGANALSVIRHTRADEESGRYELLGSRKVGRRASLSAIIIVTVSADLIIAGLIAGGLVGFGLPVAGAVAYGLSAAAIGWTFAALAGVAAQLTESAGVARAIVGALLVLFYFLRAVGDGIDPSGQSLLSWLSPIGWMQLIQPFASVRWGIFALFLGTAIVLIAAAYTLRSRRDVGAGIIPSRLGPATASPRLRGPLALAWRLQRPSLFAWGTLLALFGVVIGYLAKTSTDLLAANAQLANLYALFGGASAYSDALLTFSLTFVGWIAAAYAIAAVLQLRSEEAEKRVDHVLAASVSRLRWAGSELALVVIGSATVLAVFGLLSGLTYGLSTGNVGYELPRMLVAALAYLPAVWVLVGIAIALYGIVPRFALVSWGALAAFIGVEVIGETLKVSQAIMDLSPFTHVPTVLVSGLSVMPLVQLTLLALVLTIVGLIGFQRRSIG